MESKRKKYIYIYTRGNVLLKRYWHSTYLYWIPEMFKVT